jgi:hypothetical protein
MIHFSPPMISRTYDQRRAIARFARRKESFRFCRFSGSSMPKTQLREINGGFGARVADVAPLCDSEMASQAVGIAQNGLANGAAGSNRWAGESIRRTPYEIIVKAEPQRDPSPDREGRGGERPAVRASSRATETERAGQEVGGRKENPR